MSEKKLKEIDNKLQLPLTVLTTAAYVLVLLGYWQGAFITIVGQPLWLYSSWVNKQKGIFVTSIIILIGSFVCVLRGMGVVEF